MSKDILFRDGLAERSASPWIFKSIDVEVLNALFTGAGGEVINLFDLNR